MNEFDQAASQVAGTSKNPFDSAANQVVGNQRTALRSSLYNSLLENPDVAARAVQLGRKAGLPPDVVQRNLPEVQRKVQLDEFDRVLQDSPTLAQWLTEQNNAGIAHDDVENLGALNSTLKFFGNTGRAAKSGLLRASAGVVGVVQAPFDLAAPLLEPLVGTILPGNPLQVTADGLSRYRQGIDAQAKAAMPKGDGNIESGFYSGISSLSTNLAALPLAFLPGGQSAALTAMTAPVAGGEYGNARDKGMAPLGALSFGASQGAIEFATERLPLARLIGDVKVGTPFFQTLARQAALEVPGEQVATALQDLNEWAALNPDKPFSSYVEERPDASVQTLVATLVGVGGQVSVTKGLEAATQKLQGSVDQADKAEQNANAIKKMSELVAASKVRQRDPESFEQYIERVVEDGPVQELYIDAQTLVNKLNQSGISVEELSQASPSVAAQISEALATGGDVVIPVSEYMARVAGTGLDEAIIPSLRTDLNAMSEEQAQTFYQQQTQVFQEEADRVIGQQAQADEFTESANQVEAQLLEQLNKAGRFQPRANELKAGFAKSFYATLADSLGVTPAEAFARYPLQIRADMLPDLDGGGRFDQSSKQIQTPEFKSWFGDSKVVDPEGKPLVVYHGTASEINEFDNRSKYEKVIYFTADTRYAMGRAFVAKNMGYGDAPNLMPVYLQIKNPAPKGMSVATAKAEGYDGFIRNNEFVVFNPTQIKSATGNRGTFDPDDANILNQGERGSIAFGNDITQTPSVLTLAAGSDLSTFFHESGHFFLEVYSDLATREDAPSRVKADMAAILEWMGVKGSPELTPLQQWREMTLDERRPMHEKFARGFEAYLIKGEAPSLELRDAFRTFSAWIKNVYKGVLAQLRGNTDKALDTNLSPEIRQVMDRMLATDAQIQQAEFARSMFPTFQTAEEAGQSQEQWEQYQALGKDATATAIEQLQRKSLADMKWFANAKGKAIRSMQKRAKEVRAQVRTDVRREVVTQPVYMAWSFFRSRFDREEKQSQPKPKSKNRELNPAVDSMFVAIGMLGGLDKEQLVGTWGFDPADRAESGVFGKPVVRVNKGRTLDDMLGVLAEWGYLPVDENGKADLRDFEEAFFNELAGAPQYSMWVDYSLQRPEEDAPEVPFDLANIPSGKLSTGWLKAKYRGNEAWRKLIGLKMTSGETGLDPDVVAPSFDFDSGDAMVQALIAAEDPSIEIERLTDERMLQEFSELATPEQIERAAEAAIHNDARARFVATELEAVNQLNNQREQTQRGGTVNTIMKAAREFAEDILSRKKLRDIRPGQFANAEAKAGREAMAAQKAGDYAALAQAKRNQLLNTFAARGAVKALEEAEKTLKYLKKFDKTNVRKGIPPEYQEQIDAILDDIGLRAMSNKQIDRLKSLDTWVKQQNELGFSVDIDQRLLDRAAQKQFRELTLQEMRAVRDAIKNIEHLGRKKKQYQVARDLRNFEDVRDEVLANIEEFGGKSKAVPFKADKGSMIDIGKGVRSFFAVNRKLSSLVQQMDGGQSGGIFWQSVVRKFNDAADYRQELQDEYFPKLEALLTRLESSAGKLLEKRFIPQLGFSFDTETRMAILLNWGNEQGRSRIMEGLKKPNGELFSTADVQVVLQTFTAEELRIANDMWALIDEFWPLVVEKQKRVTGIAPDKVEAIPFSITASDGEVVQVRGGYYPLKYDSDKDGGRQNQLDTAATYDELKRGAYSHASTRRGHVEKRAETVERPIRLDLGVAVEHIVQVTQDLAFHEAIVDASRLLNDRKVKAMVLEKYGQEVWDTMNGAMVTIAQDGVLQTEKWMRLGNRLRNNVSRAIMGASMTTAFLQPFGFFNSVAKIGPRWVLNGVGNALSDVRQMRSSMQWVGEKSTFMRTRAKTFNAEMNSINSKLNGRSQLLQMYDTALFYTMQKLQMTVDVPTWIGAYNKYLSEGFEEDTAIALADQAVIDSQGSGLVKDQTEFQLNHPFLTQFYSYFAATYNLLAQKTGNTDFKNPRALMGWMSDVLFLVVMPSIAAEMVKALFKGDLDDDEPEDIALKSAKWLTGYTLGMLPLVRDLGGLISGFDYAGPPVARIVTNLADTSIQVQQGEVDQAMVGAFARTLGSLTGVPDVQLMRTYKGWVAWEEGEAPPTSILLGPPSKN